MTRHSPCIGICRLDDATGYCLGCGRTSSEIGDWIVMSEGQRDAVWQKLPARLSAFPARIRLLPWTRDELVPWVRNSIETRSGTWIAGGGGIATDFTFHTGHPISVEVRRDCVIARATDASFRLRIHEKVRAFALVERGPIVLGLPKARATVPSSSVLQPVGSDADSIDESQRSEQLFDLGLGDRKNIRLCIRTGNEALASLLAGHAGSPWPEVFPAIEGLLGSARTSYVIESAVARIEVFANLDAASARAGFLRGSLGAGGDITNGLALPDYAAQVAIFFPADTGN